MQFPIDVRYSNGSPERVTSHGSHVCQGYTRASGTSHLGIGTSADGERRFVCLDLHARVGLDSPDDIPFIYCHPIMTSLLNLY